MSTTVRIPVESLAVISLGTRWIGANIEKDLLGAEKVLESIFKSN